MTKNIDVVIPIYGDYKKTKRCIDSVLKHKDRRQHLVLINDKSPEIEITQLLRRYKAIHPRIALIEHKKNLGFIASVNEGMRVSTENDVIILNSDTVVTKDWVKKVSHYAYLRENIATVTPFSNSATIFSYPNFFQDNKLAQGFTADELNKFFEAAHVKDVIEVPSGVGYAMYITRKALRAVGFFDEKAFGKGYGEENDFCFRAKKKGFISIGCPNTFIYHDHGASFGSRKFKLMENATKVLRERYPKYLAQVHDFNKKDPFLELRMRVDLLRLVDRGKPGVLIVRNSLGEVGQKHIDNLCKKISKDLNPFVLEPKDKGVIIKSYNFPNLSLKVDDRYWLDRLKDVSILLNIQVAHFHLEHNYNKYILELPKIIKVPHVVTFHENYTIRSRGKRANNKCSCGESAQIYNCRQSDKVAPSLNDDQLVLRNFLDKANSLFTLSNGTPNIFNKQSCLLDMKIKALLWEGASGPIAETSYNKVADDKKPRPVSTNSHANRVDCYRGVSFSNSRVKNITIDDFNLFSTYARAYHNHLMSKDKKKIRIKPKVMTFLRLLKEKEYSVIRNKLKQLFFFNIRKRKNLK